MLYDGKVVIQLVGEDGVTLKKEIDKLSIDVGEDVCMSHTELLRLALEGACKRVPEEPVHKTLDKFDGQESGESLADKMGLKEKTKGVGRARKLDDVQTFDVTPKDNEPSKKEPLSLPPGKDAKVKKGVKKKPDDKK